MFSLLMCLTGVLVLFRQEAAPWTAPETSPQATLHTSPSPPPEGCCFTTLFCTSQIVVACVFSPTQVFIFYQRVVETWATFLSPEGPFDSFRWIEGPKIELSWRNCLLSSCIIHITSYANNTQGNVWYLTHEHGSNSCCMFIDYSLFQTFACEVVVWCSRNASSRSSTKILVWVFYFSLRSQIEIVSLSGLVLLMFWTEGERRERHSECQRTRGLLLALSQILESLGGVYSVNRPTHVQYVTGPPNYIHSSSVFTHSAVMRSQEGCVCVHHGSSAQIELHERYSGLLWGSKSFKYHHPHQDSVIFFQITAHNSSSPYVAAVSSRLSQISWDELVC